MKRLLLVLVCAMAVAVASAESVVRRGTGRNADYRAAVYDALAQAMSQVEGLSLQESRQSLKDAYDRSRQSSVFGDAEISDIREAMKQSVSANTKGRILSYEILSEEYDPITQTWRIEVEAAMPGKYRKGRDPDNLRRMVVMPFRSVTDSVEIAGTSVPCSKADEELADELNICLTHTRKFTMLDRAFNMETLAELSRLDMANASAGDIGRFNQLLVTDYMVIGTVKMFPMGAAVYNQFTGRSYTPDSTCMEISYRVLLVPTSQLKWSDTVRVPYSVCSGSTADEIVASAAEWAAEEISTQIIENIYPIRVTGHTTHELILNQGGRNLRRGDVFEVYRAGDTIYDVTTGESLGSAEEMIARITITNVMPKMAYAIVIDGTPAEDIDVGAIVRVPRNPIPQPEMAPPAPVTTQPGGVYPTRRRR